MLLRPTVPIKDGIAVKMGLTLDIDEHLWPFEPSDWEKTVCLSIIV